VHTLLNHYVRLGATPPWSIRSTFGPLARSLAAEAWSWWQTHGPDVVKPPYTTQHG
jgi:hypothetical protein